MTETKHRQPISQLPLVETLNGDGLIPVLENPGTPQKRTVAISAQNLTSLLTATAVAAAAAAEAAQAAAEAASSSAEASASSADADATTASNAASAAGSAQTAAEAAQVAAEAAQAAAEAAAAELSAITAITPDDGVIIVGNGASFVGESGNTARTSLGLGTGDSPTFATVTVPDEAYDATDWNDNLSVPTKNAIRDKIESLSVSLAPDRVSPFAYGAVYDGATDDTAAILAMIADAISSGITHFNLGSGIAVLSEEIEFPPNSVLTFGDLTWDFSAVASAAEFPNLACVYCDGGAPTALPDLGADVDAGDITFDLASAPTLAQGDVVLIENPTDESYSAHRTYYHAGEFVEVQSVSSATVKILGGLYAGYAAASVDVYKIANSRLTLKGGRFQVIGSAAVDHCIRLDNLRDVVLDGIMTSGSFTMGVSLNTCYNVQGDNLKLGQEIDSGQGLDYGLHIGNCQKVVARGVFKAHRHGAVAGNGFTSIKPVCRELIIEGTFDNDGASLVCACDFHGNVEYSSYRGVSTGGVSLAGNHNSFVGTIRANAARSVILIYENYGLDFQINADIDLGPFNPSDISHGVINAHSIASGINANTVEGGVIKISGVIKAPNADVIIQIVNNGFTGDPIGIDISGLTVKAADTAEYIIRADSGDDWTFLNRDGFISLPAPVWSVRDITNVKPNSDPVVAGSLASQAFHPANHIVRSLGLSTNLELVLDAGSPISAPASATKWLDLSGNGYDFFRGADGSATSTDPTFTGLVGNLTANEYWLHDGGDYFTYDTTNETWIENIHKNNAAFTLVLWARLAFTSSQGLAATGASSTGLGFSWFLSTTQHQFFIGDGTNNVYSSGNQAHGAPADWTMFAISIDEAAATGLQYISGNVRTLTPTYSSPSSSAATTMKIGALSGGTSPIANTGRIGMFLGWSRSLTAGELDKIYEATRSRFGV